MTTRETIHKLTDQEIRDLQSLIGKSICSIQSDVVQLIPSRPELYSFYKWVEIIFWEYLDVLTFNYKYDETLSEDDFIELRIKSEIAKERASKNASISFSGDDNFIVSKVQVYGYSYQVDLNDVEKESIATENIIMLEDTKGKKICIQGLYSYLDIQVTMNEDLILKAIKRSPENFDEDLILKHEIK